jgi:hypothetical protein
VRPSGPVYWIGVAVAAATVASGAVQMLAPSFVLGMVGGAPTASADHFFAIVGMFMVLFGGLCLQGLVQWSAAPLFWSALQKFGAVAAVALGVCHHVFGPLALGVAGFDLVSGLLLAWLWLGALAD